MRLARDLLDQVLRDAEGKPAGRADDFSLHVHEDGMYVESILTGGGILADDLGLLGRVCERLCRVIRRCALRRVSIPWSAVSEVAEQPDGAGRAARERTHGRASAGIRCAECVASPLAVPTAFAYTWSTSRS